MSVKLNLARALGSSQQYQRACSLFAELQANGVCVLPSKVHLNQ
jgi:pentatricopeptide repeat protein